MFYDPSSSLTEGLLMSFQQGGGWVDEEEERSVAPDALTPTLTNYYCGVNNKEEVKTEAPWMQMSQFVVFSPQRQGEKKKKRRKDSIGDNNVPHLSPAKLCPHSVWRHGERHLLLAWTHYVR